MPLRLEMPVSVGVVEASKRLSVDLFELARMCGADNSKQCLGSMDVSYLEQLRELHGIQNWWDALQGSELLSGEECLRSALGMLLQGGHIDANVARRDNLWRGLRLTQKKVVQECVEVLLDEGLLLANGRFDVSVASSSMGVVHIIASGALSPPSLVEVWGN